MSRYIDGNVLKANINTAFWSEIEKIIDSAPTIEVPTWIPCSERLPEDSGDYLVRPSDNTLDDYSEFEEIMIMPYDVDCEAFGWWTSYFDPISLGFVDSEFTDYEVIAWMPLPKPYKASIGHSMSVGNEDNQ